MMLKLKTLLAAMFSIVWIFAFATVAYAQNGSVNDEIRERIAVKYIHRF